MPRDLPAPLRGAEPDAGLLRLVGPAPRDRRLRRAALAFVAVGLFVAGAAQAQTLPPPENVVQLSAEAATEVTLDRLQLVFSTRREGPEAAPVQQQLQQALEAALTVARAAARPGEVDVRTGNFSLSPRYDGRGGTSGWVGSAELIVEGSDRAAIAALAGRIQTMSVARTGWTLSRGARERAEEEITAEAVARFRAKADRSARLFGFTGWLLREVSVGADGPPPGLPRPAIAMGARAASAEMDAPLPIEAGRATVTVSVHGSVQLTR
ncbi:MAG: SIMPL domain-containing protein [Burkholderiaceae bacterium]|nr:SIMPL domain-containing protein [Burkholderiaceae bacterium]